MRGSKDLEIVGTKIMQQGVPVKGEEALADTEVKVIDLNNTKKMMVRSGGFKIPEEQIKKKKEVEKDIMKEDISERNFEERRQKILSDLDITHQGTQQKHYYQV